MATSTTRESINIGAAHPMSPQPPGSNSQPRHRRAPQRGPATLRLAPSAAPSTRRPPASAGKAAARKPPIPPPPGLRAEGDRTLAVAEEDLTVAGEEGTDASPPTFRNVHVPGGRIGAAACVARAGRAKTNWRPPHPDPL